jgi:serine/threonine protein kinase
MAIFFKKALRKLLLKYGFKRVADCVVPDVQGDVQELQVKLAELERFMARDLKQLPRLRNTTPELDAVDIILDDVREPLGRGGYGVVYSGVLNAQPVAVKALFTAAGPHDAVVPSSIRRQMRREATIMCSLNHPNVLHVFGVVPARGWIVMELCAGGSLADVLQDPEEALDVATLLRFASETATGMAYLHVEDIKIVHGDMKAANVLLTAERSVRIADFGLAEAKDRSKTMSSGAAASAASAPSGITVAWTAPEVLENEGKSFASDVFALGVTLWETFERGRPFGGMPDMAAINQLLTGKRPLLTGRTPPEAAAVIKTCWAQEVAKRPSAAEAA